MFSDFEDQTNAEPVIVSALEQLQDDEKRRTMVREAVERFEVGHETDLKCMAELLKQKRERGRLKCSECDCLEFEMSSDLRSGICKECRLKVWFTEDIPFFDGAKVIKARLCLINLLQQGLIFSSKEFAELLKISSSTALHLRDTVNEALTRAMEEGITFTTVNSRLFAPVISKRSILTPAGEPPFAEQQAMEKSSSAAKETAKAKQERVEKKLTDFQREVYSKISSNPIAFDELLELVAGSVGELISALTVLELHGLIKRLAGDLYVRIETSTAEYFAADEDVSDEDKARAAECRFFIKKIFKGVSRKKLGLYIADYWRLTMQNAVAMEFSVMDICYGDYELREDFFPSKYVTPLNVPISSLRLA